MRIAINLVKKNTALSGNEIFFLDKIIEGLTVKYPEHEWASIPAKETKGLVSLFPLGIKKYLQQKPESDVLISTSPVKKKFSGSKRLILFCSQHYLFNKTKDKFPAETDLIITTSDFMKRKLVTEERISKNKIRLITAAPEEGISVMDWSEKLQVKEKQCEGKDFFLCVLQIGKHSNWEVVLKAYSIFKKWQQTDVRLVVAGKIESAYQAEFAERMETYKYRADVKIINPQRNELSQILPAAYGVLLPDLPCLLWLR